jgi:hypothetical protein
MLTSRNCKFFRIELIKFNLATLSIITLLQSNLNAQDLERLKEQPLIVFHGGMNAGYCFSRYKPYSSFATPSMGSISGNLDLTVFGAVNIPFSFYLGSKNKTFNQPSFKQYGLSPKYKSMTLHLGYRSLCLSNYTLNGITFFGTALEIAPANSFVKIIILAGRLRKEVRISAIPNTDTPGYERWGYGGKIELGSHSHKTGIMLFKSQDRYKGELRYDSIAIRPASNLLVGINTQHCFKNYLNLSADYSISLITSDLRIKDEKDNFQIKVPNFLIPTNITSHFAQVFSLKVEGRIGKAVLGLSYLHIDPEYKSFGCTFLNNDLENYLFNLSISFWQNRITVSSQLGLERNNLKKLSNATSNRLVSATSINVLLSKNLNGTIQYSNFSNTSKPSVIQLADTFLCIQTSRNLGLGFNLTKPGYSVCLNAGLQEGQTLDYSSPQRINSESAISFISIMQSFILTHLKQRISSSLTYNSTDINSLRSWTIGPSINFNQNIFQDKLNMGLGYSYLIMLTGLLKSSMHAVRINMGLIAGKLGSLSASANLNSRNTRYSRDSRQKSFDFRLQLNYSNSF